MDALETLLRPLANVLNRNIQENTAARELCQELSGTLVAVRVRDTALASYFDIADDAVNIVTTAEKDPDVLIEGSLIALARLAGPSGENLIRDGSVDLSGDAETANRFQTLLGLARPDLEEELSGIVGDVTAHKLGEFARSLGSWGREARSTMGDNIREYLQEESRDAPSRYEVDHFTADVSKLRDDVARAEARLNQIRTQD